MEGTLAESRREQQPWLRTGECVQHAIYSSDLELRITGDGGAVNTRLLSSGENQWI